MGVGGPPRCFPTACFECRLSGRSRQSGSGNLAAGAVASGSGNGSGLAKGAIGSGSVEKLSGSLPLGSIEVTHKLSGFVWSSIFIPAECRMLVKVLFAFA